MISESRAFKSIKYEVEDGIIFCHYTEKTHLTLELAKKAVEMRNSLCRKSRMPLLVDIRNLTGADAAAKKYLASAEGVEGITAGVLLVSSALTRSLGNIFFSVFKPQVPQKIFTDKKEALAWLKNYLIVSEKRQ